MYIYCNPFYTPMWGGFKIRIWTNNYSVIIFSRVGQFSKKLDPFSTKKFLSPLLACANHLSNMF